MVTRHPAKQLKSTGITLCLSCYRWVPDDLPTRPRDTSGLGRLGKGLSCERVGTSVLRLAAGHAVI